MFQGNGSVDAIVAQLVERHLAKVEIAGSSPVYRFEEDKAQTWWFLSKIKSLRFLFILLFYTIFSYLSSFQELYACWKWANISINTV